MAIRHGPAILSAVREAVEGLEAHVVDEGVVFPGQMIVNVGTTILVRGGQDDIPAAENRVAIKDPHNLVPPLADGDLLIRSPLSQARKHFNALGPEPHHHHPEILHVDGPRCRPRLEDIFNRAQEVDLLRVKMCQESGRLGGLVDEHADDRGDTNGLVSMTCIVACAGVLEITKLSSQVVTESIHSVIPRLDLIPSVSEA